MSRPVTSLKGEESMHENTRLLDKFYKSLQDHDYPTTITCYHQSATFKDIAFDLSDKKMIQAMWHMIANTDLKICYNVEDTNESNGIAHWTADYTFKDTGRKVHNNLKSSFQFRNRLVVSQVDDCDPWNWGMQALGPAKGFLSWLVPATRRKKAMGKLQDFIKHRPEYQ